MKKCKTILVVFRNWLMELPWWKFALFQLTIGIFSTTVWVSLMFLVGCGADEPEEGMSSLYIILLPLSALLETLIFQYVPFKIFRLRWDNGEKRSPLTYIIVSGLVFGMFHLVKCKYSYLFETFRIIDATIEGIIFGISYYVLWCRKQHPILGVSLIHYLHNMLLLMFSSIL